MSRDATSEPRSRTLAPRSSVRSRSPRMTRFADVVEASERVADTSSRSGKVTILSSLLSRLDREEIGIVVAFLSGVPHQGRVGVGYAAVYGLEPGSQSE